MAIYDKSFEKKIMYIFRSYWKLSKNMSIISHSEILFVRDIIFNICKVIKFVWLKSKYLLACS